ncbi:MAG: PilZ domain-containing protein [Candidatus Omnitrophica bacterium]|nr:PilZ domain-containing protein [Candidatus Omnitrophota bacterium]
MQEKRKYTRISYTTDIELVRENGQKVTGEVLNICLKGSYVSLSKVQGLDINEIVSFSIRFAEINDIVVTGSAVVIWHDNKRGYGLYFASLDLSGLGNLKRLIAINFKDADRIEKEFEGLIHKQT